MEKQEAVHKSSKLTLCGNAVQRNCYEMLY